MGDDLILELVPKSRDVGIALCHLKLAAEHFGKKTEIVFDKPSEKNPKEHNYVASLRLNKV